MYDLLYYVSYVLLTSVFQTVPRVWDTILITPFQCTVAWIFIPQNWSISTVSDGAKCTATTKTNHGRRLTRLDFLRAVRLESVTKMISFTFSHELSSDVLLIEMIKSFMCVEMPSLQRFTTQRWSPLVATSDSISPVWEEGGLQGEGDSVTSSVHIWAWSLHAAGNPLTGDDEWGGGPREQPKCI